MTEQEAPNVNTIALARRAVACEGWRYPEPGEGTFWIKHKTHGAWWRMALLWTGLKDWQTTRCPKPFPDLDSPFWMGWLLHLVREAWGSPYSAVYLAASGCWILAGRPDIRGSSEAEALVSALESAP